MRGLFVFLRVMRAKGITLVNVVPTLGPTDALAIPKGGKSSKSTGLGRRQVFKRFHDSSFK